ncbi:E3 ubiquitin-protein ligase FANCL [Ischnura elegans]|uniref:E3 ubiquitin-protein ligase FANCL n=1 Tax=Ischnura elegans TaxID=197161 RepID=UPI001ED87571|nr:E3 ubiquitin-protein ligase FANCL [Ischnura elegans]
MDDKQNLQILKEFPMLIPQNRTFSTFNGFVVAGGEDFHVYIDLPNPPSVRGMVFFCQLKLRWFLDSCKSDLQEWENSGISLLEFLIRLKNLIAVGIQHGKLEKCESSSHMENLIEKIQFYSRLIKEVQSSQWKEEISIEDGSSREFNEIQLRFYKKDEFDRVHTALVKFESATSCPLIIADLPSQVELTVSKGMTASQMYEKFVEAVDRLQDFWNLVDDIDESCWVIDPEQPKRKDSYRRIIIGTNVSLYLSIDPLDPHKRPDITFIGSERTVMPFRNSLQENLEQWDSIGVNIVSSLTRLLGLQELPSKPSDEAGSLGAIEQGECSICLCLRLDDGLLPSEVCNNALCAVPFHAACLFVWLQSFPTSHQNFNRLYGECPNCNSAISCPILS